MSVSPHDEAEPSAAPTESVPAKALDEPASDAPRTELDKLVEYLLAAKRSLSSTTQVWRANEIVNLARGALEESVAVGARTGFLGRGIHEQYQVLRRVKAGTDGVAREGQTEFEAVLRELDVADARLQQSLDLLKSTAVQASFRAGGEEAEQKTLHDFVDEEGVDNLKAALRGVIDEVQETQHDFDTSIKSFEDDLNAINTALPSGDGTSSSNDVSHTPIPSLFQTLETHAKEMANLLESLVRHFDLCVAAIKQTEGGGAAAQEITGEMPTGLKTDAENEDGAPPEPVSHAEKSEMLQVLETDAAEVEYVVLEMRDRLAEMETHLESVNDHVNILNRRHADTTSAFHLLEELGTRLPECLSRSQEFLIEWKGQRQKIEEKMEELEGLRDFYDGFLAAYDDLIIEVDRRREVESKMNAIARDTAAKLDRLYEDDLADREAFRQEQGEYLPSDIWPGLTDPPRRFDIAPRDKGIESVPVLAKKVVEQAIRRANGRL
ncbi:MAG: hypothetical protein M4579_004508 [Chaenotheca gracillima]|nr:MAG: hypothetical protein M4579_004508 [Chaenotheca gracillima]